MKTYRILIAENIDFMEINLYDLVKILKQTAPQIDWIVCHEKILNHNDKYEDYMCMKVPKVQYEAAEYLYSLVNGSEENKYRDDPILNDLETNLGYLAHISSFSVEDDEFEDFINKLSVLLSEVYLIGTQLPPGINLHLEVEHDVPYDYFPDIWIENEDFFQEEMNVIQDNITFILYETSKYSSLIEEENNPLEAGIVFRTYQSFHSDDGWGIRLLETVKLIHQLKNKLIEIKNLTYSHDKKRGMSLKATAKTWIKDLVATHDIFLINNYVDDKQDASLYDEYSNIFSFHLVGFADQPEVFVQPTMEGIKFGYHTMRWEGPHHPVPALAVKQIITWELLGNLTQEKKENTIIETFLKTIDARKRQYKTCQFCNEKFPPEHRFNIHTCHGCATKFFGVIY